jgi:Fe-S-cluster-containing hydrogenase component 2
MGKAIKCDLCKDRKDGPVCVELCLTHALSLVPRERRAG